MRRIQILAVLLIAVVLSGNAGAAEARIKKVLPQFIDLQGRSSLSPSLYERDAYQFLLRNNPEQRSGVQFKVQWKGASKGNNLRLRVQLRGVRDDNIRVETLEMPVKNSGLVSDWTTLTLREESYKSFGELAAWRATIWDGDKLLSEQKSFLW